MLCERTSRISDQLDGMQHVVHNERFEDIELEMTIGCPDGYCVMISHNLRKKRDDKLIGNVLTKQTRSKVLKLPSIIVRCNFRVS